MELKVKETELEKEMATAGKADIPKMKTNIRLSKLEFKKFNGDTLKWQEFWDSFEATIHKDPTMSPINKFNYLRTQLEDRVLKIIEELELTNANYETAITLLQEHYGKKKMVLDAHYTHLMDLAQASNNTSSFRVTYDAVETHLRSLQSLGENIHHRQIISIVRTKLPKVVIARLEQQKDPDEEKPVEALRKSLKNYISTQEVAESQVHQQEQSKFNNTKGSKIFNNRNFQILERPTFGHTTEALLTVEIRPTYKTQTCAFCEVRHWTDECKSFLDIESQQGQLKGKCFICLRNGHTIKDCKVEKPCFHCGQVKNQHCSSCPKKFRKEIRQQSSSTLLSYRENFMMQTATVVVSNKDIQIPAIKTRILMNTESQWMPVTEEIVKQLQLSPSTRVSYAVFTFGPSKPKQISTPLVAFDLKLNYRRI